MEPSEQLAIIIPTLIEIVDRLDADQLDNATPCANFDVQGVLDHMIGGASAFVPAFLGEPTTESHTVDPTSPTPPGQVPAGEFRTAMTSLLDAVNAPGAMERMIDAPFGLRDGDTFALATTAPVGAGPLEQLVAFSGRTL